MKKIKIGDRLVGHGELTFIIAEVGVNHDGKLTRAKELIEIAVDAGADAVKFQTFIPEEIVVEKAPKAAYQKVTTDAKQSQLDMLRDVSLSFNDFVILKNYCDDKGITFLSTPFDLKSINFLAELGVAAIKVTSTDTNNLPALKHIASMNLPVILSTGMSTLGEIEAAVDTIYSTGNDQVAILHCTSNYPTLPEDCNLRSMHTIAQAFQTVVGYSDHSLGIEVSIGAVALGASIIEKHFTIDKSLPGPDHQASLNPDELRSLVKAIRNIEKALGDGIKKPVQRELEVKNAARKSIVALVDIPPGTDITTDMLAMKRPGTGIEPKYIDLIIGRKAKRKIEKNELISWDCI